MAGAVVRRRVIVAGRVQGVGFRAHTRHRAEQLKLAGSARNLPDGTVEVEAEGPADAVDELVLWLRTGPRWASVEGLDVQQVPPKGDTGFAVR